MRVEGKFDNTTIMGYTIDIDLTHSNSLTTIMNLNRKNEQSMEKRKDPGEIQEEALDNNNNNNYCSDNAVIGNDTNLCCPAH